MGWERGTVSCYYQRAEGERDKPGVCVSVWCLPVLEHSHSTESGASPALLPRRLREPVSSCAELAVFGDICTRKGGVYGSS